MRYNPFFDARQKPEEPDEEIEYNEVDQYGKRFRKVGHCIEYEPEINGIPRSVFFRSQKAQKIADEERRKREAEEQAAFSLLREGLVSSIIAHKQAPHLHVYPDQIVWGRSPVRIDLAGGWTDTPPYCL